MIEKFPVLVALWPMLWIKIKAPRTPKRTNKNLVLKKEFPRTNFMENVLTMEKWATSLFIARLQRRKIKLLNLIIWWTKAIKMSKSSSRQWWPRYTWLARTKSNDSMILLQLDTFAPTVSCSIPSKLPPVRLCGWEILLSILLKVWAKWFWRWPMRN